MMCGFLIETSYGVNTKKVGERKFPTLLATCRPPVAHFIHQSALRLAHITNLSHPTIFRFHLRFGHSWLISGSEIAFRHIRQGRHLFLPVELRQVPILEEFQGSTVFEE